MTTVITYLFKIITVITIYTMSSIFQKLLTKLGFIKGKDKTNTETQATVQKSITELQHDYIKQSNLDSAQSQAKAQEMQQILNMSGGVEKENYNEQKLKTTQEPPVKIYDVTRIDSSKINTIWDVIKPKENTQAEHIINCLLDDQWMDMDELKQRIKLQYNIEYQNEKSLYPYIKTLTDINLVKLNNTGKKRTWKKNIIFIDK